MRPLMHTLGNALLVKGQFDDATSHYQQALQLRPDYNEVHDNFGDALWRRGKIEQAIEQWEQAFALRPDDPKLHGSLGAAFTRSRHFGEAVLHYEKALAGAEPTVATLNNFALLLGDLLWTRNFEMALEQPNSRAKRISCPPDIILRLSGPWPQPMRKRAVSKKRPRRPGEPWSSALPEATRLWLTKFVSRSIFTNSIYPVTRVEARSPRNRQRQTDPQSSRARRSGTS